MPAGTVLGHTVHVCVPDNRAPLALEGSKGRNIVSIILRVHTNLTALNSVQSFPQVSGQVLHGTHTEAQ